MANPFRDIGAGALDLLGTPLDIAGMGAGLVSGTASFLAGDGFWNGFTENPFTEAMQDYHQGVTNLTGANEDSLTRRLVGAADMIVGAGVGKSLAKNVSKKALAKKAMAEGRTAVANRLNSQIAKNSWKDVLKENVQPMNLAKNVGMYAVGDTALGLLTPGESNGVDRAMQGIAALYLGTQGTKALLKSKGIDSLKKSQTLTDVTLTPEQKKQMEIEDWITSVEDNIRRSDLIDRRGGTLDNLRKLELINPQERITLNVEAQDRINLYPTAKKVDEVIKDFDAMPTDIRVANEQFGVINAELGARRSTLVDMLEHTGKLDPENAKRLRYGDLIESMEELSKTYNDFIKGLPNWDIDGLLSQMKVLGDKLQRRYFLTPKLKELLNDALDISKTSGLINKWDYDYYRQGILSGSYVPIASAVKKGDVVNKYKRSNPFLNKRHTGWFDTNGKFEIKGVDNPGSAINAIVNKVRNELEAAEQNMMNRQLVERAMKTTKEMRKRFDQYKEKCRQRKDYDTVKRLEAIENLYGYVIPDSKLSRKGLSEKERYLMDHQMKRVEIWNNGTMEQIAISPMWEDVMKITMPTYSTLGQVTKRLNSFWASLISGPLNVLFLAKRIMYGLGEMVPAVYTTFDKNGHPVKVSQLFKNYFNELKLQTQSEVAKVLTSAIENETFTGKLIGDRSSTTYNNLLKYIQEPLPDAEFFLKNDIMGEAIRNNNGSYTVNGLMGNTDIMMMSAKKYANDVKGMFVPQIFIAVKTAVDNATNNTVIKTVKSSFNDVDHNDIYMDIMSKMTDIRRKPKGDSLLGKGIKFLQDYMPYGTSSVQGLVGKAQYLPKHPVKRSARYIQNAYEANAHSIPDTALDVMHKIGIGLAKLPDNAVFDILWKTVAIPTAICYIWNNSNNEQSSNYHSLKEYEKSNKFLLANFLGPGINVSIPMDQEWSVLKNVFEIMLDGVFGLSQMDEGNPAFSYKNQLCWSIGQDIGISLPVPAEALVNMTGYKTNLDPTAPFTDENMIEAINKYRYKRLNPEFATVIESLTSKLGKFLVNMVEDRDVFEIRNAIPFMSINPHQERTSATVSWLNQQLKINPTPELKSWQYQRNKLLSERKFYSTNGCTKKGEVLGDRTQVLRDYDRQIAELDKTTYIQLS